MRSPELMQAVRVDELIKRESYTLRFANMVAHMAGISPVFDKDAELVYNPETGTYREMAMELHDLYELPETDPQINNN